MAAHQGVITFLMDHPDYMQIVSLPYAGDLSFRSLS